MNGATTNSLQSLDKSLRRKLESAVKEARDVAEEAARTACTQLCVGLAEADSHLTEEEKDLRRRLRIHGRQLGDQRDAKKKTQELDRLVEEIAYEHWHRMLFARFLAENNLLMYPDPDQPVAISVEECEDLAEDEGAANGWELAARFAAKMLPQIFRVDSPVFSLTLPSEKLQQLEKLVGDLDEAVFTASDSLGWVYQFWQAKRKDEVNASEVKIGARELPAVTQLFTEPYMVSFLLDNSLGAWWAARRLTEEDFRTAESEQELRDKAALPGVPLDYLRFVRTPSGSEGEENTGPWTPAAGTFDAWPESLSELKTLDPCCGSGHFLVAALLMLTSMRMELDTLSAKEAVDRVLSENLHGLEIDQRCVELAAFALALAAWRLPDAGGYRVLPDLNVACCGLSVSVAKEEWKELGKDNKDLKIALDWMYDEFKDAPVLGSLLNPAKSMASRVVTWDELSPLILEQLKNSDDETIEKAVVAKGIAASAILLSQQYEFVLTNVPYLVQGKQSDTLAKFCENKFRAGQNDLATAFLMRLRDFASDQGAVAIVSPQNWLYQKSYEKLRELLLNSDLLQVIASLGAGAFDTIGGEVVKVSLCLFHPTIETDQFHSITHFDVSGDKKSDSKANNLATGPAILSAQLGNLDNPDSRILAYDAKEKTRLSDFASALHGQAVGDNTRFNRVFWEVDCQSNDWEFYQMPPSETGEFKGRDSVVFWENESGEMAALAESVKHLNHKAQQWRSGKPNWGKDGVAVNLVGAINATLYTGEIYSQSCCVVVPHNSDNLSAIWEFAKSRELESELRLLDPGVAVSVKTVLAVPFSPNSWSNDSTTKSDIGEPYSDDPTQWLFHGHPASSTDALQVAVARLLGYRWPAELDAEMELATDARAWVERASQLTDLADNDGIVCIPAVGTEQPAEDRLLNLLHRAYKEGRTQEQVFRDKLDAADENDPVTVDLWRRDWQPCLPDSFNKWRGSLLEEVGHQGKTLESWLRDKFFTQHCKLFHHRPFIWHIWDGLKDGFSALINYHKLDNKTLKTLIYKYLNNWIDRQNNSSEDGSEEREAAAKALKLRLEKILEGESPHDIFVRWKPLEEQPIGWDPDLNDGVRLNIRPWMTVDDVNKKGAGVLRDKPNCKWTKDRGKDVESAPWYTLGPEYGGKESDRINDHHLTLAEKNAARKEAKA